MDVAYSIAAKLGSGIGYTAENAIKAINNQGWMKQLFTLKELPIEEGPWKDFAFDNLAAVKLDKTDIFHGWCNMSYSQILKAHMFGAKTVIERASSHVLDQYRIMVEEFKKFGIKSDPISPLSIRKQLNEYELSDYITTPSEYARRSLLDHHIADEKILYMPYGVDIEIFKPNPIEHEKFIAVFIGENWIRKNIYRTEKAWAGLNLKDAELILRSNAPFFKEIDYNSIHPIDWVKDINHLYNSCDVFILPSLEEGCCLVVLEAMASGLPVIISKNTGVEITDGKEGFYVNPYDIRDIQDKLIYFYKNRDEIKKMGKAARKFCLNKTWDNYGDFLIQNYEKIEKNI